MKVELRAPRPSSAELIKDLGGTGLCGMDKI